MKIFISNRIKLFSIVVLTLLSIIGFFLIPQYLNATVKCFDVVIPPFDYNNNYISRNVVFFSDGSFTVNNDWDSVDDATGKRRYGYVMSYLIDANDYFNSVKVELDKSEDTNGYVVIELRAGTDKYSSDTLTDWYQLRDSENNKIIFYPDIKYKYLQFKITFDSEPFKPVVKSLSIKAYAYHTNI